MKRDNGILYWKDVKVTITQSRVMVEIPFTIVDPSRYHNTADDEMLKTDIIDAAVSYLISKYNLPVGVSYYLTFKHSLINEMPRAMLTIPGLNDEEIGSWMVYCRWLAGEI